MPPCGLYQPLPFVYSQCLRVDFKVKSLCYNRHRKSWIGIFIPCLCVRFPFHSLESIKIAEIFHERHTPFEHKKPDQPYQNYAHRR